MRILIAAPPMLLFIALASTFTASAQIVDVCTIDPGNAKPPALSLDCKPVGDSGEHYQKAIRMEDETSEARQKREADTCDGLLPPRPAPAPLDTKTLANLLTTPDLSVSAQGDRALLISAKTTLEAPALKTRLTQIHRALAALLSISADPPPFSMRLVVPHAAAVQSRLQNMSKTFTVTPTATDRIVVTTTNGTPSTCEDWKGFLDDARSLVWSIHPESSEARLTALSASDVSTALGTGAASAAASSKSTTNAPTPAPAASFTIAVAPQAAATSKSGAAATTSSSTGSPAPTTVTVASVPVPAPAAPAAPTSAPSGSPATVGFIAPDQLVFSDPNPGDDATITEAKRVAAVLDLPRPEMSITAWVMQNSSTDPSSVNETSRLVREEVNTYNEGLENTVLAGWKYLKRRMAEPSTYFDSGFYNYVAKKVIYDGSPTTTPTHETASQTATRYLREATHPGNLLDDARSPQGHKPADILGACPQNQYCLGYTTLFQPLKPRLLDLLLGLIAADKPVEALDCSVNHAEAPLVQSLDCLTNSLKDGVTTVQCKLNQPDSVCRIWRELIPADRRRGTLVPPPAKYRDRMNCEEKDYIGSLNSLKDDTERTTPVMFLNCFRETAAQLFASGPSRDPADPVNSLGMLRAAVVDFLFNYKLSQQYPHEFDPYDLSTSAQTMNTALRPMVDAFNRDVAAYQSVLKRKLGLQIEAMNRHLTANSFFDKPRFFNNAIVTVNTIANSEATVDTSAESYLEALNPPTLGGLAQALSATPGLPASTTNGAGTTATTALGGLLSTTRFNEAQLVASGLSQFQSSRVHLGRELSVDVKPESLNGANSAELQVTLKADDEGSSGSYSSGSSSGTDAEVSRIGKSDTTTRIRVDSLKLFEVSSFASQLEIPKKRFPILPIPFLEMPYFGSILSVPVRPGREFHSSIAIMSAVIIPTAADLAFTARFVPDRLLVADTRTPSSTPCRWPVEPKDAMKSQCIVTPIISLHDFGGRPIREFNHMKAQCFAMGNHSARPSVVPTTDLAVSGVCESLSYDDALADRM